ncbi:MAG: TonB-dependent receptor [Aureispira sp.]|nr:TonB-dependent receptor [Aureispira sp.]
MSTRILGVLFFILGAGQLFAQDKVTLSGYIKDSLSGEDLIGANIYFGEIGEGATTNIYGFYSIKVPAGKHTIQVSYIGYNTKAFEIEITESTSLDFKLTDVSTAITQVTVKANKDEDATFTNAGVGTIKINVKNLEKLPVFMGEKDILKSIQLLPGISATSEGSTGLTVRGGTPDQNLILLDEAPVYNPSHFLGFFSVFNSDALKDLTVYKGGIPAQYGGRASSVLDIYMKNGNNQRFSVSGGLGLISSRLTVEGPIVKDKGSFIVSGRTTYLDLLMRLVQPEQFGDLRLGFWDVNVKANYAFGKKDRLYLSGYIGRDDFKLADAFGLSYGNYTATLRWNHVFNEQLFSNTSFFFSKYDYGYTFGSSGSSIDIGSGIMDFSLKQDYSWYVHPKNTVRFGFNSIYHIFEPGELKSENESFNGLVIDKRHSVESAVYISNEQKMTKKLSVNYGLRLSMFNAIGPGDIYAFNDDNDIIDTTTYKAGEHIKTYFGIEPRLALTYQAAPSTALQLGYHRIHQYIHLLTNSTSLAPNDMWMPSSTIIKPQIADQVSLGLQQSFLDKKINITLEGYYKNILNQIDYEDGADILLNDKVESQVVQGTGYSFGGELLVTTKFGGFNGWVSYTLAQTRYKIDGINKNRYYSAKQDRTHDIAVVGTYDFNPRWTVAASWIYQTGNAVTFPSGKYEIEGQKVSYYTERNGYRMPASHRLDLSVTFRNKPEKKFRSSFTLALYNVYNRKNPYTISFRDSETNPGTTEAVQLSLFGIVPAFTWNFEF